MARSTPRERYSRPGCWEEAQSLSKDEVSAAMLTYANTTLALPSSNQG
jgi:hypothetical protein